MMTMSSKGVGVGIFAVVLLFAACNNDDEPAHPAAAAPTWTPPTTSAAPPTPPPLTVTQVIDGDSFDLSDGSQITALGIDSCELGTKGGQEAKESAELWLGLQTHGKITLASEPGVDRDTDGRLLRYVQANGIHFEETMVGYDHTGVKQGATNNASPAFLKTLRELDSTGRSCGGTPPAPPSGGGSTYVPVPDNDDDHHRESRFCSHRRWC